MGGSTDGSSYLIGAMIAAGDGEEDEDGDEVVGLVAGVSSLTLVQADGREEAVSSL